MKLKKTQTANLHEVIHQLSKYCQDLVSIVSIEDSCRDKKPTESQKRDKMFSAWLLFLDQNVGRKLVGPTFQLADFFPSDFRRVGSSWLHRLAANLPVRKVTWLGKQTETLF